jgi:hypothetical protein
MIKYLLLVISIVVMPLGYSQSSHKITINSSNNVATLEMTQTEYDSWKTNSEFENATKRQALFKDIYKNFKDDFDFIFLVLNETAVPNNWPDGELISVSNATSNIGIPNSTKASLYGSAGKLKAVMSLSQINYIKRGPSLHELMHTWGNFIIQTSWVDDNGTGPVSALINNYKPHWGFTGGSSAGQLGGFNQADLQFVNLDANRQYFAKEFGGFANYGNSVPYTEFELYLMGMIPLSDVKPFDVFSNITWYQQANANWDVYFNGTKTTYTPVKIETDFGMRTPTSTASQKDFKLLIVVLSPAVVDPIRMTTVSSDATWLGLKQSDGTALYNFWEATGGRGTMETDKLNSSLIALSLNNYDLAQQIVIYPIPAYKIVNIKSETDIENITIANILGQQMQVKKTESGGNQISLDMSSYSPGIYFISIKNIFGNETVKKIVVE